MSINYDDAIQRIAERTIENTKELRKSKLQRRTEFTDLYGIPFTVQGDASNPAEFYISISPDLISFMRFQFKLHIQSFKASVSSVSSGGGEVDETALAVDPVVENSSSTAVIDSVGVVPNPHSHSMTGGSATLNYGIKKITTTSDSWAVSIDGIDITDYLIEQQGGDWIEGEGVYPSNRIDGTEDFYDVLSVASLLYNSNAKESAERLLRPGFKLVQIASDAPFAATMYLYCKYSNMGR